DDFDAGLEQLRLGREVGDLRGVAVNWPVLVRLDRTAAIDRLPDQVEYAAQRRLTDRNADRRSSVDALMPSDHAVGAAQGDAPNAAAAEVLLHLAGQIEMDALVIRLDLDGVVDRRQRVFGEFDVERRADHLRDAADARAGSVSRLGIGLG